MSRVAAGRGDHRPEFSSILTGSHRLREVSDSVFCNLCAWTNGFPHDSDEPYKAPPSHVHLNSQMHFLFPVAQKARDRIIKVRIDQFGGCIGN